MKSGDPPFQPGDKVRHVDSGEVETVLRVAYIDLGLGPSWRLMTLMRDGRGARWAPAAEFTEAS